MKLMTILAILTLTACAPMVKDYPNPISLTKANVPVNRCLHFGECDGRPYPVAGYAGGLDPRWASDSMNDKSSANANGI
jgi:hypothetical protein